MQFPILSKPFPYIQYYHQKSLKRSPEDSKIVSHEVLWNCLRNKQKSLKKSQEIHWKSQKKSLASTPYRSSYILLLFPDILYFHKKISKKKSLEISSKRKKPLKKSLEICWNHKKHWRNPWYSYFEKFSHQFLPSSMLGHQCKLKAIILLIN